MRTYSAYFSTTSTINTPIDTDTENSSTSWNINWRKIFGNRVGECRVRGQLISQSNLNLEERNDGNPAQSNVSIGSVRANFLSNTSDATNYLNLGMIKPVAAITELPYETVPYCYLEFDSTASSGVTMVIPNYMNQSSVLTIQIRSDREEFMLDVPEYQLWLYFDVDDEIPIQHNVEQCPVSFF